MAGITGVTESQTLGRQGLERRELRRPAGQPGELARLRWSLNRQRGGEVERITANTLIRVAGLWFTSPRCADEPGIEV